MTTKHTPRRPHCDFCSNMLELLEEAVKQGLHFTAEEREKLLADSMESADESRHILESRGYTKDAKGRWGYHKHPIH